MNHVDYGICESQLYLCNCSDDRVHVDGSFHDVRCKYAEWFYDADWIEPIEDEDN